MFEHMGNAEHFSVIHSLLIVAYREPKYRNALTKNIVLSVVELLAIKVLNQ